MIAEAPHTNGVASPPSDKKAHQPKRCPPAKAQPAKRQPGKALPSFRMNVEKTCETLRAIAIAYGTNNRPVGNLEVGKIMKMHPNNVGANNTFLASIGLLIKNESGGYTPSAEVLSYNRAYDWNPDSAAQRLASAFERGWIGQTVLPLVNLRARDESEILTELAEAALAPPDAKPQLLLLLDWLDACKLIVRENGTVRRSTATQDVESDTPKKAASARQEQPSANRDGDDPGRSSSGNTTTGKVRFSVQIDVDLQKMANWSPSRIEKFFAGMAQVIAAEKGTTDQQKKGASEATNMSP